jgi:hypothetical protein
MRYKKRRSNRTTKRMPPTVAPTIIPLDRNQLMDVKIKRLGMYHLTRAFI